MRASRAGSVLFAVQMWIAPAVVCAQTSAGEHATPTEALEYFQSARVHYREGRYPEAATDLERALTLDPSSPTLHYNLARVYELMGRLEDALVRYRHYLGLLPPSEGEERERIEETIQRLEGAIEAGPAEGPQEMPPAEPLRELEGTVIVHERGVADLAFFATLGAGAALLAASAITGGIALERASTRDGLVLTNPADLETHQARYASLDAEANALGITTDVLLGAGGVTLIAAVLLFVLREQEVEREIVPEDVSLIPFITIAQNAAILGVGGQL